MTEHICEKAQMAYSPNGDIYLCKAKECPRGHMGIIHFDAEPINLCLANGKIPAERSLVQKVQDIPSISLREY